MSTCNILVVENDSAVREMLGLVLEHAGFLSTTVSDVTDAQDAIESNYYDLILLDWRMQGTAGVEWGMKLKKDELFKNIPIVYLIARGEEEFILNGLELGVEDYVTKPFSPKELIARIRIVLSRQGKDSRDSQAQVKLGDIVLDTEQRRFSIGDKWLEVGPTRFRLMHFFMTHPDKVFTRNQLMDHIWGRRVYIEERTIDVHIRRLRQSLDEHGRGDLVQTVRGFGYRFSLVA